MALLNNNNWYKNRPTDKVWWLDNGSASKGERIFSFNKIKKYNLFKDYPKKLSKREREIFDRENPQWKNFFGDR